jgi:aldose 1-epimerase
MDGMLRLESDAALVEVLPRLGGSIMAFDLVTEGERLEVFRRWSGESESPRTFASSPMVPWFNRLSGGGFAFDGVFYPVAPNDPLDDFPLHGDGWFSPWEVVSHDAGRIELRLRSRAIPPFDYEARLVYALSGATLDMELSVKNLADRRLPYGLGQHPWFPRSPETRITAPAAGVWLERPPEFAPDSMPAPIPQEYDFSRGRQLPVGFIDNGFAGWDGRARIDWPDRGLAVDIQADPQVRFYHVYSLNAACPYFCFEPVTHPNNALAMSGSPEARGLRVLAPGEETAMSVRFKAERL